MATFQDEEEQECVETDSSSLPFSIDSLFFFRVVVVCKTFQNHLMAFQMQTLSFGLLSN